MYRAPTKHLLCLLFKFVESCTYTYKIFNFFLTLFYCFFIHILHIDIFHVNTVILIFIIYFVRYHTKLLLTLIDRQVASMHGLQVVPPSTRWRDLGVDWDLHQLVGVRTLSRPCHAGLSTDITCDPIRILMLAKVKPS